MARIARKVSTGIQQNINQHPAQLLRGANRIDALAAAGDEDALAIRQNVIEQARGAGHRHVSSTTQYAIASMAGKQVSRAGLRSAIAEVESQQEKVRNKRQMASTAFQNFDQKSNQQYNLLSSIMKAMNEMRMGTVRNML